MVLARDRGAFSLLALPIGVVGMQTMGGATMKAAEMSGICPR